MDLWVIVLGGLLLCWILFAVRSRYHMPKWAKPPCSKCGGVMVWVKGHPADSTWEARFKCRKCDHEEYRGGGGSEIAMETWENKI